MYRSLQSRIAFSTNSTSFKTRHFKLRFRYVTFIFMLKINDSLQWIRLKRCSLCHLAIFKLQKHNKMNLIIVFIIPAQKTKSHTRTSANIFLPCCFFAEYLFSGLIIFVFQHFNIRNGVRETETVSVEAKSENWKNQLHIFMSKPNGWCLAYAFFRCCSRNSWYVVGWKLTKEIYISTSYWNFSQTCALLRSRPQFAQFHFGSDQFLFWLFCSKNFILLSGIFHPLNHNTPIQCWPTLNLKVYFSSKEIQKKSQKKRKTVETKQTETSAVG